MSRVWNLLHLVGLALSMGGLVCQLILLARYKDSPDSSERSGSEKAADTVISYIQAPGVYLAIASGLGMTWAQNWQPLSQGWLQFKLLFVFWIWLATRLMGRNASNFRILRQQSACEDPERLRALKDNHRMIGYVTICTFFFVIIFSLWRPF